MKTIKAKVSEKVLEKATRFFTGSVKDRTAEVLQNARRSKATLVEINQELVINKVQLPSGEFKEEPGQSVVTVQDNGFGIQDWDKLLHLGASGWNQETQKSEDPAGIGLFSLAPRCVTIQSRGKIAIIEGDAWLGKYDVEVREDTSKDRVEVGTRLRFVDDYWGYAKNEVYGHGFVEDKPTRAMTSVSSFSDMQISFNGKLIPKSDFIFKDHPFTIDRQLNVAVQMIDHNTLNGSTAHCDSLYYHTYNPGMINFFGHVIITQFPPKVNGLCFLIDILGESDIKFVLPDRNRIVENAAHKQLVDLCNKMYLEYVRDSGKSHALSYSWFQKAQELGVVGFPESVPQYRGISGRNDDYNSFPGDYYCNFSREDGQNVKIIDGDTSVILRVNDAAPCASNWDEDCEEFDSLDDEIADRIACAVGHFSESVTFRSIANGYEEYSWAKNADRVKSINVVAKYDAGNSKSFYVLNGDLTICDKIEATITCSSGKTYVDSIPVCCDMCTDDVLSLKDTVSEHSEFIRFCGGGYSDDESIDIQEHRFFEEIELIEKQLKGEGEVHRTKILNAVSPFNEYPGSRVLTVKIDCHENITIFRKNGTYVELHNDGSRKDGDSLEKDK
jgi:hypothetical protein